MLCYGHDLGAFFPARLLALACAVLVCGAMSMLSACGDDGQSHLAAQDALDARVDTTTDAPSDAETELVVPPAECGNKHLEEGEECEGTDLGGLTCATALGAEHTVGSPLCVACAIDTSACEAVTCAEGERFVGGGCVAAVSAETYVPATAFSYMAGLDLGATGPPCCADLDGDTTIDNALKDLLNGLVTIGGGLNIGEALADAVESGELSMVVEYRTWPGDLSAGGDAALSFFTATNDLDGDGVSDQTFADRLAGDGLFALARSGFGDAGAVSQFNRASVAGGMLRATYGELVLPVVVPGLFTLRVQVERASLEASLTQTATGPATVDSEELIGGVATTFGGAKIAGLVTMPALVEVINDLADDCTCAGLTQGTQLMTTSESASGLVLTCDDAIAYHDTSCTDDPAQGGGFLCTQLTTLCAATTVLIQLVDIDSNGNGVRDAFSTGIRVRLVGATLDAPFLATP